MRPSLRRRLRRRRLPRFEALPRHAQRQLYREARQLVRDRGFAGRVHAYEALAEDDGSPCVDFVFVGERTPHVYQATACTTARAYLDRLESEARASLEDAEGNVAPERLRALLEEWVAARHGSVHESWRRVPAYAFGIGLEVVLDAPTITPSTLVAFVDRYLACPHDHEGERGFAWPSLAALERAARGGEST